MPNREFTPSSGNVFADLNLPQADDLLVKAELATKIIAEIQRQRMTQIQAAAVLGIDRNAWAVQEANWTYKTLGVSGRAKTGDAVRQFPPIRSPGSAILLAYTVNELPPDTRAALLDRIVDAMRVGVPLLIVEPISRKVTDWWPRWVERLSAAGARADDWRFPATLPPLLRQIAKGAGLDPRELTARSISNLRSRTPSPGD